MMFRSDICICRQIVFFMLTVSCNVRANWKVWPFVSCSGAVGLFQNCSLNLKATNKFSVLLRDKSSMSAFSK